MAKEEKTKSAVNRSHKFRQLPIRLLDDLDTMILRGKSAKDIQVWMEAEFKGIPLPSLQTTNVYVPARKKELFEKVDARLRAEKEMALTEAELREIERQIDTFNIDPANRKANLEQAIRILFHRVGVIRQLNRTEADPRHERIIGSHLATINSITSNLERMEGRGGLNELVIGAFLQKFFTEFIPAVKEAFEKNHKSGDVGAFLEYLNKRRKKIDLKRIQDEAYAESAPAKGGKDGQQQAVRIVPD